MNIFDAIEAGLHDDELDALILACKVRAKAVPLSVGDKVRVTDQCSPKYMQGVLGTIVSKTTKVKKGEEVYLVKPLDSEQWKLAGTKMVTWRDGDYKMLNINMPRSLIMKVEVD